MKKYIYKIDNLIFIIYHKLNFKFQTIFCCKILNFNDKNIQITFNKYLIKKLLFKIFILLKYQ